MKKGKNYAHMSEKIRRFLVFTIAYHFIYFRVEFFGFSKMMNYSIRSGIHRDEYWTDPMQSGWRFFGLLSWGKK